jgi:hypothetical protein
MTQFVLKGIQRGKEVYYTGRAGEFWVSEDPNDAFVFSTKQETIRKQDLFNNRRQLHGIYFSWKELSR